MCQVIVGKVISVNKNNAKININGKIETLKVPFTKVAKDDYVICAADYVIEKIDEEEAKMIMGNFDANKK